MKQLPFYLSGLYEVLVLFLAVTAEQITEKHTHCFTQTKQWRPSGLKCDVAVSYFSSTNDGARCRWFINKKQVPQTTSPLPSLPATNLAEGCRTLGSRQSWTCRLCSWFRWRWLPAVPCGSGAERMRRDATRVKKKKKKHVPLPNQDIYLRSHVVVQY